MRVYLSDSFCVAEFRSYNPCYIQDISFSAGVLQLGLTPFFNMVQNQSIRQALRELILDKAPESEELPVLGTPKLEKGDVIVAVRYLDGNVECTPTDLQDPLKTKWVMAEFL